MDWTKVAQQDEIPDGTRLNVKIQDRYITIVRLQGQLSCIDSVCYHAGGPLGIGDIEDIVVDGTNRSCLVCPWHHHKVDAQTGDKYFQAISFVDGKGVPGDWKSNGVRQRIHQVEERTDGIYVALSTEGTVASDSYAQDVKCGDRVLEQSATMTNNKGSGSHLGLNGSDGKMPTSGAVAQQLQAPIAVARQEHQQAPVVPATSNCGCKQQ